MMVIWFVYYASIIRYYYYYYWIIVIIVIIIITMNCCRSWPDLNWTSSRFEWKVTLIFGNELLSCFFPELITSQTWRVSREGDDLRTSSSIISFTVVPDISTGQYNRNPLKNTSIHSLFLVPLSIKVIGINNSIDGHVRVHE